MSVLLSAIAIVLLLIVVLGLFGTLREVSILQGKVTSLEGLLLKPPEPRFFDGMLPERVLAELAGTPFASRGRDFFLVFVRQACPGCATLLEDLKAGVDADRLDREQLLYVVAGPAGGLDTRLRDRGCYVLADEVRALTEACQVKQTPTILHLDKTLKVLGATVGGDMEWIYSRGQPDRLLPESIGSSD
jgi:hypothetical protein